MAEDWQLLSLSDLDILKEVLMSIRTHNNAVVGFSEVLQNPDIFEVSPKVKKRIAQIHWAGSQVLERLTDAYDLVKIEQGTLKLYPEPTALKPLLTQVLESVEELRQKKDFILETRFPDDLGEMMVDGYYLQRMLFALLKLEIYAFWGDTVTFEVKVDTTFQTVSWIIGDSYGGTVAYLGQRWGSLIDRTDINQKHQDGMGLGIWLAAAVAPLMGGQLGINGTDRTLPAFVLTLPIGL